MGYDYSVHTTFLGRLFFVSSQRKIHRIFLDERAFVSWAGNQDMKENPSHPVLQEMKSQLEEYLKGERTQFQIPFEINGGTSFQRSVWSALLTIPYGKTASYQQIARMIGKERAVRAVGQANRANPLPILIPCHRVIGKNGQLTGYAGSRIDIKEKLLALEGFDKG